jgi:haloalkane dehalogenase
MTTTLKTIRADISNAFREPHARIEAAHGRLAYWRFGKGPDVVLVHGWPLHSATYRALIPLLAEHFTLHLFDMPGTGKTSWEGPIDFETNAAALKRAVDEIGLKSYALFSHDSGGVIARLVAARDARVRGLVLIGSEIPMHHSALLQAYAYASRMPGVPSAIASMLQIGMFRRSPIAFGTCFTDGATADGDFADLFVRPLAQKSVMEGQMGLLRAFSFDVIDALRDVHAHITAPTLCIWGERDPFFPIAKARAMLGEFAGGAELAEVVDAKLFVHEDHPHEVASHALPFLARCFAGKEVVALAS